MADYRKMIGRIVTDAEGAVGGVSVTVNYAGTTTAITLKDNKAGSEALANPFDTDANGVWAFFTDIEALSGYDYEVDVVFDKSGLDFSVMNEMYENITMAGLVTDPGAVQESDFNATTFLYATLDDTPEAKTPAEVMAILSGAAAAAFDFGGQDLINGGVIFLAEQAAAETDRTDEGQVWVKTGAPNTLWFTDDAGTDLQLGVGAISVVGTPVDNQLAIWKSASSLEGDTNLTWSGTQLDVTGNLYSDGENVSLDGNTSARIFSAGFIRLQSPSNRIGVATGVYMEIATTVTSGITTITHQGTAPTVLWTVPEWTHTNATSHTTYTPSWILGFDAGAAMTIAVTDTTGVMAITHAGSGVTVTWTAPSFDFVGPVTLSNASAIGLNVSGACTTHAISISVAQTGSGLHIGDTWKLGFSDGAINIGGDGAIAFGSVADNICIQRVDLTAQLNTTGKYVIAKYQTLATSGAGTGTTIWMGDYTKITVAHDITDAYGSRGKVLLSGTLAGNQVVGTMGNVEITGAATLADTGGAYGVYGSIESSGSGASDRNVAAGYFTLRSNTIDLVGVQACVVADIGGSGYADYGFLTNIGNNNTTAGICVNVTDSAVLPVGIKFLETVGSITAEIMLTAGNYIMSGSADPNGSVTGVDGSLYCRTGTAAASTVAYVCTGTTTWSALGAVGTAVTKVGTPVDNEIGVWTGDGTIEGDTNFQWDGSAFMLLGTQFIKEQANAAVDKGDYGQIWVKSGAPNTLWFTDDAGTDLQLGQGGDVSADVTPQLGGDLDVNTHSIVSAANGDIPLTPNGTGRSIITAPSDIVTTKTAIATLTEAEAGTVLVSCAATPYTITLPTAVGNDGLRYHFIKTDANYFLITLAANGAQTFNYESATGAPVATYPRLNTYCAEITVVSDGANWQCINEQLGQIPECRVYLSTDQLNLANETWTLVEYDTESYDIGSNFNVATHKFVAPIPGVYQIADVLSFEGTLVAATRYGLYYKVNTTIMQASWQHASMADGVTNALLDVTTLAISDEITVYAVSNSGNTDVDISGNVAYPLMITLVSKS